MIGTAHLLSSDICNTTVNNERIVWGAFDTNTASIGEVRFTVSQSTEGQSVSSVDGIKAEQFPMNLDEAHRWTKVISTGCDDRLTAKLVEVFVAMGGVIVRDDNPMVVFEAQPSRIEPPVTASTQ